MARFDRNVLRPRLPLQLPQQVVVVVVLLAGMVVRTGAILACYDDCGGGDCNLVETDGKHCHVPEMNAAFAGEMSDCDDDGF
eukprot:gene31874-14079_t